MQKSTDSHSLSCTGRLTGTAVPSYRYEVLADTRSSTEVYSLQGMSFGDGRRSIALTSAVPHRALWRPRRGLPERLRSSNGAVPLGSALFINQDGYEAGI